MPLYLVYGLRLYEGLIFSKLETFCLTPPDDARATAQLFADRGHYASPVASSARKCRKMGKEARQARELNRPSRPSTLDVVNEMFTGT
jgi:hypothetical protein